MAGGQVLESTSALNGIIKAGDTVAVAVGDGRASGGMRIGTVLEITGSPALIVGFKARYVKVRVEKISGYNNYYGVPYVKTYEDPTRIVKL